MTKNKAAQSLAKLKHKKNPNSVEHMKKISLLGVEARRKKQEYEKTYKNTMGIDDAENINGGI